MNTDETKVISVAFSTLTELGRGGVPTTHITRPFRVLSVSTLELKASPESSEKEWRHCSYKARAKFFGVPGSFTLECGAHLNEQALKALDDEGVAYKDAPEMLAIEVEHKAMEAIVSNPKHRISGREIVVTPEAYWSKKHDKAMIKGVFHLLADVPDEEAEGWEDTELPM